MAGSSAWATSVITRIQLQDPASLPLPSPHPPFPGSSAALGRPGAGLSLDQPLAVLSCRLFPWVLSCISKALASLAGAERNPGDPGRSPSNRARAGGHLTFAEAGAPVIRTSQLASLMLMC